MKVFRPDDGGEIDGVKENIGVCDGGNPWVFLGTDEEPPTELGHSPFEKI